MKPNIILPNKAGNGANETINANANMVIIGANGAGKTKIGSWIEFNQPAGMEVHRISAQRVLNVPETAAMQPVGIAENTLFYGSPQPDPHRKLSNRWGNNRDTMMLSDYDKVLATLFAKSVQIALEHAEATKLQQQYIAVPPSPIDIIKEVWPDIMPQTTLSFRDNKVLVTNAQGQEYHGKRMSDGERVTLYLLGQCICAKENSIIIIDEPEIHLHKSLIGRLWNKIEELCTNKSIIYITHDLDFAASRKSATKLWIKSYNTPPEGWTWDIVPAVDEIPEALAIEIIGNRKNILFCEGDKGGFDHTIFQACFPTYHVIPRGGCEKVIESTKAINGNAASHHLQAVGIIDTDYRTAAELQALAGHHISAVKVAEIENLFCIEPILRIVAQNQQLDQNQKVTEITDFIIHALTNEFDTQVTNHAEREIRFSLTKFEKTANNEHGLTTGMNNLIATIDIPAIYTASATLFQQAIDDNSLEQALKIYNRKSLAERISPIFGLANREYVNIVLRLLNSNQRAGIIAGFQAYMPAI